MCCGRRGAQQCGVERGVIAATQSSLTNLTEASEILAQLSDVQASMAYKPVRLHHMISKHHRQWHP